PVTADSHLIHTKILRRLRLAQALGFALLNQGLQISIYHPAGR
ncbi:hypothetical protein Pgy4_39520, partial [Pseudomonas savastanoi pv. glycinea str. race 4]